MTASVRARLITAFLLAAVVSLAAALASRGFVPYQLLRVALPDTVAVCTSRAYPDRHVERCMTDSLWAIVRDSGSQRGVARIEKIAGQSQLLAGNCHRMMHAVGKRQARRRKVDADNFTGEFPSSSNANCAAGFMHGLMVQALADLERSDIAHGIPAAIRPYLLACSTQSPRLRRNACTHGVGHGLYDVAGGEVGLAIDRCMDLGATDGVDCAQGAYHQHWWDLRLQRGNGWKLSDRERHAHKLCTVEIESQRTACWLRAAEATRPSGAESMPDAEPHICRALDLGERTSCIAAAARLTPAKPSTTVRQCDRYPQDALAVACLRGLPLLTLNDRTASEVYAECGQLAPPRAQNCTASVALVRAATGSPATALDECLGAGGGITICRTALDSLDGPLPLLA